MFLGTEIIKVNYGDDYEVNMHQVDTKASYSERKLYDMGIHDGEQPNVELLVIIKADEDKEGYVNISNVKKKVKLPSYKNGYSWVNIPFQKQSFHIKKKRNKKGFYIEISNKPYYGKVRVML